MPEKKTQERARQAERAGKAPSTQAGEFVREEIEHAREGKHGVRSPEQAIAIGLSKARRAGVPVPPKERASPEARQKAERDRRRGGASSTPKPSVRRSRAVKKALDREGGDGATPEALAKHARRAAQARTPKERSEAAKKAARTRTPEERSAAAKKAAATRRRNLTRERRGA